MGNPPIFNISILLGITVCKESKSMADAGRKLFGVSRLNKKTTNDSHRIKQVLAKFDLVFDDLT